jgi:hypothetical protein
MLNTYCETECVKYGGTRFFWHFAHDTTSTAYVIIQSESAQLSLQDFRMEVADVLVGAVLLTPRGKKTLSKPLS